MSDDLLIVDEQFRIANYLSCAQLYLKSSKIFNKIQDFNYQNFKKCQKIVFVIVTLIFKWSGKVGLKINKVLKTKII